MSEVFPKIISLYNDQKDNLSLAKFFILQVVLTFIDVITDLCTAIEYLG